MRKIFTCDLLLSRPMYIVSKHYKEASVPFALDKAFFSNQKVSTFFLFLDENICCGYSLEAPPRGTSNEYPQHMFSLRSKKTIHLIPTLI